MDCAAAGSAAVYGSTTVCGSAAVCSSASNNVWQCDCKYARSARGSVRQCA
jgi:hypothetical protein